MRAFYWVTGAAFVGVGLWLLWAPDAGRRAGEERYAASPPAMGHAATTEPVGAAAAPRAAKTAALGDTITMSDSTWTVISAKDLGTTVKSNNSVVEDLKSEGGKYIAVVFKVTNLGKKEERIFGHPKLRDSLGREFDAHDHSIFYLPKGKKSMQLEAIPPGLPKEFWAIYEVPETATGLQFMARELAMSARSYPVALGL